MLCSSMSSLILPSRLPAIPSMLYSSLALILLCGLSAEAGNGDLSKVEVDMTMEDYGEPQKLKCHNCYLSVNGNNCMTLEDYSQINVQECLTDEPYCVTQSLYTDYEVTTFERKCSRDCRNGCEVAGDTYRLETCATCCKDDYCNDDIAGAHLPTSSPLLLTLTLLLCTLTLLRPHSGGAPWN